MTQFTEEEFDALEESPQAIKELIAWHTDQVARLTSMNFDCRRHTERIVVLKERLEELEKKEGTNGIAL